MRAKIEYLEPPDPSPREDDLVDPRAAVHPDAEIGPGCRVGPFAVIGPGVSLGPGCIVHAHAVVEGPTILGADNVIHPFARIGGPPQDRRHRGEKTFLVVGRGNDIREHVTINRGTRHGGGRTTVGDENLIMAYSHVAHDCVVGSHIVMANHATLAGHAVVEDFVVFGGLVAVGQFLRVGESAMLAAGAMIERDVPPFCVVAGDRARLKGVNRVGLERRAIDAAARQQIKAVFRALYDKGRPVRGILAELSDLPDLTPEARRMLAFIAAARRGLTR